MTSTAPRIDVRSAAVTGKELFETLKQETLENSGTVFYLSSDVTSRVLDSGERKGQTVYVTDVYDEDGEMMGRLMFARLSIIEQISMLRQHYPDAPAYGPFTLKKVGKTYKLVAAE